MTSLVESVQVFWSTLPPKPEWEAVGLWDTDGPGWVADGPPSPVVTFCLSDSVSGQSAGTPDVLSLGWLRKQSVILIWR